MLGEGICNRTNEKKKNKKTLSSEFTLMLIKYLKIKYHYIRVN